MDAHTENLELIAYRLNELENRVVELAETLKRDYLNKREIQAEYLSQEASRRIIEQKRMMQVNLWVAIGGIIVAICAVGAFILQLVILLKG